MLDAREIVATREGAAASGAPEAPPTPETPETPATSALQADMRQARRRARRLMRLQREHPLFLRRQRQANRLLAAEWAALIAVTLLLAYAPLPWLCKVALLVPWAIYSSLALDVAIHYFNHWPLFERPLLMVLLRALGILVFTSPLEVRYHHWEHHKYSDPADDPQLLLARVQAAPGLRGWLALARYLAVETTRSIWGFLPLSPLPPYIRALRRTRPAHYWEIVVTRWAAPVWLAVLLALRWRATLLYLLPATLLVAPLASLIMNLTDHAPSALDHPFRQATYFEPATRLARLVSWINHFTAATHLTHHLFPQVHWLHVRRLQRRLLPLYRSHGAPQSLIVNSMLLGNPLALLRVLAALRQIRAPAVRWPAAAPRLNAPAA
jgi:fatty acid desaturase